MPVVVVENRMVSRNRDVVQLQLTVLAPPYLQDRLGLFYDKAASYSVGFLVE